MGQNLDPSLALLEPTYLEWGDNFILPEEALTRLAPSIYDADLVLLA